MLEIVTDSTEKTMSFGEKIGRALKGGEIIELIGDVGSGKTALVKGIAKGAKVNSEVSSPTFAIMNEYHGRVGIRHLDLYRLKEAGLIAHQVEEAVAHGDDTVIIEWSDTVKDLLPQNRLVINIIVSGENARTFKLNAPENLSYLMENIK